MYAVLQILINILIMFPWSLVLLLSFLVNKWQLMFRPIGGLLWYSVDWLDQRLPTLVDWMLWFWYQISLTLHVLTVGINLGVIWVGTSCIVYTCQLGVPGFSWPGCACAVSLSWHGQQAALDASSAATATGGRGRGAAVQHAWYTHCL